MSNTDKRYINTALVQRLISSQFPQWANLTIKPVEFGGWDNRTFHLGEQMTVRLPSNEEYAPSVEKEQPWLPMLAPLLPLPIPTPLAQGLPTEEYPWHWSIYKWLDGDTAEKGRINNLSQFVIDLAQFLAALQRIDASNGPCNFYRGSSPLSIYDTEARQSIDLLRNTIDAEAATIIWDIALSSTWQNAPVWFHGDLAVGNILVRCVMKFAERIATSSICIIALFVFIIFKARAREIIIFFHESQQVVLFD